MAIVLAAMPCVSGAEDLAIVLDRDMVHRTAPQDPPVGRLNTTRQAIELVVPVRERGPLGQATILIAPDDTFKVRGSELINALARILTPEATAALQGRIDAEGYITPEAARILGIEITFDTGLLDLAVEVPLELRQTQVIGFGFGDLPAPPTPTDLPQPFAAYLNYRATQDYFHRSTGFRDEGFVAPRVDLDLGGNVGPVAFENFFTIDGDAEETVTRQGSRLIYDQPAHSLRWTLGDLLPEGRSFQTAPDIAGLSVARLYSLSVNDRFLAGRSSQSISLREPSQVDIRINGALTRTLNLTPGTYDLRDLPLTAGANAIEIVIESPTGQRQVLTYDYFSDTTLLVEGADEFFAAGGIFAPRDLGPIDYQEDNPIFSGFYRRGINSRLTLGANLQAAKDAVLVGGEAVMGSRLGLTVLDVSASQLDGIGEGAAARVTHRYTRAINAIIGAETYDFSVEARTEDFTQFIGGGGRNYPIEVAARYSRPISNRLAASIGANYAVGRDDLDDRYGVSANGNYRLDFNTSVNFGAVYASDSVSGEETNVYINLIRRFGARSTFTASAESRNGRLRAGYSRAPERTIDDWAFNADAIRTDESYAFNGSALYITNRGEFEINHDTILDDGGDILDQRTSLRAYGSIAYAGGRFGIGRRIYDSFALVDTHPSLEGRPVLIRGPEAFGESARSGAFGSAVVPLGSYYSQQVPYDVENLPIGYDLGTGEFQVLPRYHSGYALTVGSDYFVTATGLLVTALGEPLALRSGRAVSLDDPNAPSPEVITNRVGRFAVSGLAEGRWRLTFQGSPPVTYDIVVPATTLYRAGTLSPTGSGD